MSSIVMPTAAPDTGFAETARMISQGIFEDIDPGKIQDIPYKYRWARYVTRQKLIEDWRLSLNRETGGDVPTMPVTQQPDGNLPPIPSNFELPQNLIGEAPKGPDALKVGIVGAGVAGLFTGMILDFLNDQVKDLNIDYEILEANSPERVGGRLFTHEFKHDDFPEQKHQYYDVGAMRFPKNGVMKRTFDLFDNLEIKPIKYYIADENGVQPYYYNDIQYFGAPKPTEEKPDPYALNTGLPLDSPSRIPEALLKQGPGDVIGAAVKTLKEQLANDIDKNVEEGWKALMACDFRSTRNYLCYPTNFPEDLKIYGGLGYNFNTATWMETFEYGTGWYDQALSETILEQLDFDYPGFDQKNGWFCVDGGSQGIARKMQDKLKNKPKYNRQVTKIQKADASTLSTNPSHDMQITTKGGDSKYYYAVFNSTTLGAMQQMDLTKAGLTYGTKQAIRCLGYGASCKVAMRFRTKWWMDPKKPYKIKGGLAHTDMPLRVCVYPSYNVDDPVDQPAVLLVSYSWAQDAQRLGALISPDTPNHEEELKELLIRNLARLHTPTEATPGYPSYEETYDMIKGQYMTHHAWDWYADPYMSGAFAYFGPGQFSNMWPEICRPNGKLWIIGEAASAHHAWIVGALESSVRAVWQMLWELQKQTGNPAYQLAKQKLEDPKSAPFGPLPLYINRDDLKQDAVLGLFENKLEIRDMQEAEKK